MTNDLSEAIVSAVFLELVYRSGFRQVFDSIDEETTLELRLALETRVYTLINIASTKLLKGLR